MSFQSIIDSQSRLLSRIDLIEYNRYVFGFRTPPHMQFVIEDALMDPNKKRLLVILPFKHAKSPIISVVYPTWSLGNDPFQHFILVSNSGDGATTFSKSVRDTIRLNARYREVFPEVELDLQRGWGENNWYLKRPSSSDSDPSFRAVGYTGSIIGRGADQIIWDDLNGPENTYTDYLCEKVNLWWQEAVRSRRLYEDTREIGVTTRWHRHDVASEAMKPNMGYWVYHMPALSDGVDVYCHRRDPQGNWEDILIHQNGPALWPQRWSASYLAEQEGVLGTVRFNLMYQGRLLGGDEGWIAETEFVYIDEPDEYLLVVQVWDTGLGKRTLTGSYTAMVEIGITATGFIDLLKIVRRRMNAPDINDSIYKQWQEDRPDRVGIEEAAAGVSSIQLLRREHPEVPIVPIPATRSKPARASLLSVFYHNHQVRHLRGIPRLHDYEQELLEFTKADTTDMVDAMAHAVTMVQREVRPSKRTFLAITGDRTVSDKGQTRESIKPAIALW